MLLCYNLTMAATSRFAILAGRPDPAGGGGNAP